MMIETLLHKYKSVKKLQEKYHEDNQEFESVMGFTLKLMRNRKDYLGSEANKEMIASLSAKEFELIGLMDTIHNLKLEMYEMLRSIINAPAKPAKPAQETYAVEDSKIAQIIRHHTENLAANLREMGLDCESVHFSPKDLDNNGNAS